MNKLIQLLACSLLSLGLPAQNNPGVTPQWKLGIQLWTFHMFTFTQALEKVDSAGVKFIEAYFDQPLGGGMQGSFGTGMSAETRTKIKQMLHSKGIQMVAMGVIDPRNRKQWIQAFNLARDFGLSYITAEPLKTQWDMVDSLAGAYHIKVAIHDHPRPNPYWHPDSVLAAIKGHSNIGSCADVGHWARNGLNPVTCLKELQGHIIGVHFKDIVKFDDTEAADTAVGKGIINFEAILAELKRQGFSGMISIEQESNLLHNLQDVKVTVRYINALVAKLP